MSEDKNKQPYQIEYIPPSKLGTKKNPYRRKVKIVGKCKKSGSISRGICIPPKWLLRLFDSVGEEESILDKKWVGIRYGRDTALNMDVITIFKG